MGPWCWTDDYKHFDYLEMATTQLHTAVPLEAQHYHILLFLRRSHAMKLENRWLNN